MILSLGVITINVITIKFLTKIGFWSAGVIQSLVLTHNLYFLTLSIRRGIMFWFLASKYKSLEDFNPLVIIAHHQFFSVIWFIWNIHQWGILTISLHELTSEFAQTLACFFLFLHSLHIYDLYQWIAFFSWLFPQNHKLVSWKYWSKLIPVDVRVTKNFTNGVSIFEHDLIQTQSFPYEHYYGKKGLQLCWEFFFSERSTTRTISKSFKNSIF